MGKYTYSQENDRYIIYEDNHILTTTEGNKVTTLYKPLADKIIFDLEHNCKNINSFDFIPGWHFKMIDYFLPMGKEKAERTIKYSFMSHPDWTFSNKYCEEYKKIFGNWNTRKRIIAEWISKITLMQKTAVFCISSMYESINLAFILALILERYNGENLNEKLKYIAKILVNVGIIETEQNIYNDFKNFELYYGIHLEEEGTILDNFDIINGIDDIEIDVFKLPKYKVTVEQLKGRNYYHYVDGIVDDHQAVRSLIGDFDLSFYSDDDDDEYDDEYDDDDYDDEVDEEDKLGDYLPKDCWIKRFVDDDLCTYYLLYLVIGEDGNIKDSGCLEEVTHYTGCNNYFFMVPGMKETAVKSYDYIYFPPEIVTDDLRMLFKGRSLPLDFSFIGKRLPQAIIDRGGNGGRNTEYTYALQSAYRMAYMHMSITTTEEGIIKEFSYSTYKSSGSGYGDMFSRPSVISDRDDEAMDMLLYLYDMYLNRELKENNFK